MAKRQVYKHSYTEILEQRQLSLFIAVIGKSQMANL